MDARTQSKFTLKSGFISCFQGVENELYDIRELIFPPKKLHV